VETRASLSAAASRTPEFIWSVRGIFLQRAFDCRSAPGSTGRLHCRHGVCEFAARPPWLTLCRPPPRDEHVRLGLAVTGDASGARALAAPIPTPPDQTGYRACGARAELPRSFVTARSACRSSNVAPAMGVAVVALRPPMRTLLSRGAEATRRLSASETNQMRCATDPPADAQLSRTNRNAAMLRADSGVRKEAGKRRAADSRRAPGSSRAGASSRHTGAARGRDRLPRPRGTSPHPMPRLPPRAGDPQRAHPSAGLETQSRRRSHRQGAAQPPA